MGDPIADPLNTSPPTALAERKCFVQPNRLSTVRVIFDEKKPTDKWFYKGPGARPIHGGTQVEYLIRGRETFARMVADIESAKQPGHFVYLLGWYCEPNFPLIRNGPTLERLLTEASGRGVELRGMLWANSKSPTESAATRPVVELINRLPTGRAILDNRTVFVAHLDLPSDSPPFSPSPRRIALRRGSHHQKVLIVNGDGGLSAYCGGLDIVGDRVDRMTPNGFVLGLHDTQVRLSGDAVSELLSLFIERWDDYLKDEGNEADFDESPPRDRNTRRNDLLGHFALSHPSQPVTTTLKVQIGRTTPKNLYGFAPAGEQTARSMLLHAIGMAERSIFMEEQYAYNLEAADALSRTLSKSSFEQMVILLPDDNGVDIETFGLGGFKRAEFFRHLRSRGGAEKLRVVCGSRYTHSKLWIFDDEFVVIGSANCNRRGWEHDSEAVVGIYDESEETSACLRFAKRMRIKLWADHFNLDGLVDATGSATENEIPSNSTHEYAAVADGLASAAHWFKRSRTARHRPYVPDDHGGRSKTSVFNDALLAMDRDILGKSRANHSGSPSMFDSAAFAIFEACRPYVGLNPDAVWDAILDPASPL